MQGPRIPLKTDWISLIPQGLLSFLALKDSSKRSINSDWKIELPGEFQIAGTTVRYVRRGLWEKISAKGPTKTPLHVMVSCWACRFQMVLSGPLGYVSLGLGRRCIWFWRVHEAACGLGLSSSLIFSLLLHHTLRDSSLEASSSFSLAWLLPFAQGASSKNEILSHAGGSLGDPVSLRRQPHSESVCMGKKAGCIAPPHKWKVPFRFVEMNRCLGVQPCTTQLATDARESGRRTRFCGSLASQGGQSVTVWVHGGLLAGHLDIGHVSFRSQRSPSEWVMSLCLSRGPGLLMVSFLWQAHSYW
jgi:hypothetical protein